MITKEHILQAKKDVNQIFDDLLANFEPVEPISNITASISGRVIDVQWESNDSFLLDIEYYDETQREWQHSVLLHTEQPVHSDEEQYHITVGNSFQDGWVRTCSVSKSGDEFKKDGKFVSDPVKISVPDSVKPSKFNGWTALWSHNKVDDPFRDLMTAGITDSPNFRDMADVLESGKKVIPLFGGFDKDHSDTELRQRVGWYVNAFESIGWDNIKAILLRDEPFLKGLNKHQLDVIVSEARKRYKAPLMFTFTQNSVRTRSLPDCDIAMINFYPFFKDGSPDGYAQIFDYSAFKQEFDSDVALVREKIPDADIAITAQVFGSPDGSTPPWRIPEPETAEWYMRAMDDSFVGLSFWGWESKHHIGFSELPELQTAWKNKL